MTRSVVLLLHGDAYGSLYYHPLGLLVVGILVAVILADVAARMSRALGFQAGPFTVAGLLDRVSRGVTPWVGVVAVIGVWLFRLPLFITGRWIF